MFAREHRAAQGAARRRRRRPARPRRLRVLDVGRRPRPDLRASREGPAHRLGRVHRRRDRARSSTPPATRSCGSTCCCRRRTASAPAADGHAPRSTSATPRRLGRPARRRRRGLPPGRPRRRRGHGRPTCPTYAAHNDLGTAALLAAMPTRGVDRLVLASSMVVYGEGRYVCPTHGAGPPPAAAVAALEAGDFENHCPICGAAAGLGAGRRGRAARPAQRVRRRARSPRSTTRPRGRGRRDAAAVALRYHNVYGPGMPRDTPYSGVAAMFRSSLERGRGAAGLRGRRPDARLRARRRRRPRQPRRASRPSGDGATGAMTAYNVCSGSPVSILDVAALVLAGTGRDRARGHRAATALGDVRHVVASPARAARRARLHRRDRARAGPRRSSPPRRCATDPGSPARGQQVLHDERHDHLEAEAPAAPALGQQGAADSSSHGTNGSQIRSTSALLIWERSATTHHRAPAATSQRTRRGVRGRSSRRRRRAWADAGEQQRAGAEGEGGEVAPHPVRRRPVVRRPRPSSARAARAAPPTSANPNADEREHHRQGRERRRHERPPRPGDDEHRQREQPQQRQAVGLIITHQPEQQPGHDGPADAAPRTAATASAAHPPGRPRRRTSRRPTRTARPRPGPNTRNGAARRACCSAPSTRSVSSTATAVDAAMSVTTRPAANPLPSPSRSSTTKNVSAPGGWPATCTGQLAGSASYGDPADVLVPASRAGRSSPARCRGTRTGASSTSPTPPSRRRARARASRPAHRRTPPPAADRHDSRAARSTAYRQASTREHDRGHRAPADARVPVGVQRRERSARARPSPGPPAPPSRGAASTTRPGPDATLLAGGRHAADRSRQHFVSRWGVPGRGPGVPTLGDMDAGL